MSDERGGRRSDVGGRIDAAIDRAVRDMLDVEPPADLRTKVLRRVEVRAASTLRWKILVPIGAAALLILAVTLVRRFEAPAPPPTLSASAVPRDRFPAASTPRAPIELSPAPPRGTMTANSGAARMPADIASASSTGTTEASVAIEPLNTISPIDVAPIPPRSITPDPIDVSPLDPITEMQIAPLNSPDRRD
jgi:hypothetical protein